MNNGRNTQFNPVEYETRHGTIGSGFVADVTDSPLTGKTRIRIVDFPHEAADDDAGKWFDACDCWQPEERWLHNPAN